MSIEHAKREGLRFLQGIENGNLTAADAYNIADGIDPVLVYFTLRYLREKYPASAAASAGVSRRLVELTSTYDDVVKLSKQGERDPLREWFDDTYDVRDYFDDAAGLIDMLVEKIEG
jgi:hypothetical protein